MFIEPKTEEFIGTLRKNPVSNRIGGISHNGHYATAGNASL